MNPHNTIYHFAEEILPTTFTPVLIGNQWVIVASQNRRRLEQTEMLGLSLLTPKGDLIPFEYLTNNPNDYNIVINAFKGQIMEKPNFATTSLHQLIAHLQNQAQNQGICNHHHPLPCKRENEAMDTTYFYPLHLTRATSSTEISCQNIEKRFCWCDSCRAANLPTIEIQKFKEGYCDCGCNTEEAMSEKETRKEHEKYKQNASTKLSVFEQRKLRQNLDFPI